MAYTTLAQSYGNYGYGSASHAAAYTDDELQKKYGTIIDSTVGGLDHNSSTGYYQTGGGDTLPGTGEGGWQKVQEQQRTAIAGTAHADEDFLSDGDYAILQQLKSDFNAAQQSGDQAAMQAAHDEAERIRARYGYSGGGDGSQYLPFATVGSSGSGSSGYAENNGYSGGYSYYYGGSAGGAALQTPVISDSSSYNPGAGYQYQAQAAPVYQGQSYTAPSVTAPSSLSAPSLQNPDRLNAPDYAAPAALSAPVVAGQSAYTAPVYTAPTALSAPEVSLGSGTVNISGKYRADTSGLKSMLDQWQRSAISQSNNKIDYTVQKAVADLQRALEDAQPQFQSQAASIAVDERQGMDNSALYSELRGDRGGIGQSQYNEIQATAARNRQAVQQAQVKLSTDTARQIEDLRAQGEFEKADAALQVSQTYLSKLTELEQWAAEYNLSADQFEAGLQQWQADYALSMAQFQTDTQLAYDQLNTETRTAYDRMNSENSLAYDKLNADTQLAYDQINNDNRLYYDQLNTDTRTAYDQLNSENRLAYDRLNADTQLAYDQLNTNTQLAYDQLNTNTQLDYDRMNLDTRTSYDQMNSANQLAYDKLNASSQLAYDQLNAENTLAYGKASGVLPDGSLTAESKAQIATMGKALLNAGVMPSLEQLQALGLNEQQAREYIRAVYA